MKDFSNLRKSNQNNQNLLYKNLNIIRKLKDYEDKEKIALLLNEYNKKQETDYFLTQNNIKIGKIHSEIQKTNPFTYNLLSPKKNNFQNQRRQVVLSDSSYNSYSNILNNYKRSMTNSSRKITRLISNIDSSNNSKKNVINKVDLKKHFNNIRQRIHEYNSKNKNKRKNDTEIPFNIRNNLYKQELLFKKIKKEKQLKKISEENIKTKSKKNNIKDLLINKSSKYNQKNLEFSILDKNMNTENKYRNNFWNITLRNNSHYGKFEKLGYFNVGNKFEPTYTYFNMNKNLEFFMTPKKNQTDDGKKGLHKKNLSLNIDDNLYSLKTRKNLKFLEHLRTLEVDGKNLLNLEEAREKKIKGNKILYKNEYLEYLYNKKINKLKFSDGVYDDKIFAKNYTKIDFMKNINLNLK